MLFHDDSTAAHPKIDAAARMADNATLSAPSTANPALSNTFLSSGKFPLLYFIHNEKISTENAELRLLETVNTEQVSRVQRFLPGDVGLYSQLADCVMCEQE
jgi:hypothetical protein